MSFTLKCDNCGNEQKFKTNDSAYGDNVSIEVYLDCGYVGCNIESIDIDCQKCFKGIKL